VSDIAAIEQLRSQKTVSLNLKARQEERAQMDKDRLARENSRRAAKGQAVAKTVEEIEKDDTPDIVLAQAAEVMGDMVTGDPPKLNGPRPAQNTPSKADEKATAQRNAKPTPETLN
jgi:hypothetical protein